MASMAPISPRSIPRRATSRTSSARGIFKGWVVRNDWDRSPLEQEAPQSVAVIGGVGGETATPRNGADQSRRYANVTEMAGLTSMAMGRPCESTMAWIFVVRPPRERPIACTSAPLFRPPPNGAL
jgi:hypothetical protein